MSNILTSDQYWNLSGNVCPVCKSDHISAGDWEPESTSVRVTCKECDSSWSDVYKLKGFDNLEYGESVKPDEKTIEIDEFGITIALTGDGGASITSDLKESGICYCGVLDCLKHDDDEDDVEDRESFNNAMDGLESIILAHAVAGIDVTSPDYIEGIETAVQSCGSNYS